VELILTVEPDEYTPHIGGLRTPLITTCMDQRQNASPNYYTSSDETYTAASFHKTSCIGSPFGPVGATNRSRKGRDHSNCTLGLLCGP